MMEVVFFVTTIVTNVLEQVHVQYVILMALTDIPLSKLQDVPVTVIMTAHVMMDIMMTVPETKFANLVTGNVQLVKPQALTV